MKYIKKFLESNNDILEIQCPLSKEEIEDIFQDYTDYNIEIRIHIDKRAISINTILSEFKEKSDYSTFVRDTDARKELINCIHRLESTIGKKIISFNCLGRNGFSLAIEY